MRRGHDEAAEPTHRQRPRMAVRGHCRRGSTATGVLAVFGVIGAFAATVYFVGPTQLHGRASAVDPVISASHETNQHVIDMLAALIGRSAEVLAVHPRTGSPYLEVVLRLSGSPAGNEIAPEEIAVISHSSILHTVMLYAHESEPGPGRREALKSPRSEAESRVSAMPNLPGQRSEPKQTRAYSRNELLEPGFCDRWRSDPNVQARLLAKGISDMQIGVVDRADERSVMMRLALIWSPDSSDGSDEAAVMVNAAIAAQ